MGKARVAPLKYITIPRMELVTATLSVKISVTLRREFQISITFLIAVTKTDGTIFIKNT